jgi:hypothetical protein
VRVNFFTYERSRSLGTPVQTGLYSSAITGLSGSDTTIYYVRAYVTNSAGTFYGKQRAFIRGVISYHWQPSESAQPVCKKGMGADVPWFGKLNTGSFNIKDSSALWLDKDADGNRYSFDLQGAGNISYGCQLNPNLNYINHSFYVTAKNTVPRLQVLIQRTATAYDRVIFRYSHDTVYCATFDSTKWTPVQVNLKQFKSSGSWMPFFVNMTNLTNDSVRVSFGCANQAMASVTVADTTGGNHAAGSAYCWAVSDSPAGVVSDVHMFSSYDTVGAANIWSAFFSPSYFKVGPVKIIPTVINNILYDPPGNASYSTCTFDSTISVHVDRDSGVTASIEVELGVQEHVDAECGFLGIAGATSGVLDFEASVNGGISTSYHQTKGSEFSLSRSTTTSSSVEGDDSTFIGPTLGDVVVFQSVALQSMMMKRPRMSKFRTAADTADFVYASIPSMPVPSLCSSMSYTPIQTMVHNLQNDSAGMALLQTAYPYDLKTGKIVPSSLDSLVDPNTGIKYAPRLVPLENPVIVSGNVPIEESRSRDSIASSGENGTIGLSFGSHLGLWVCGIGGSITASAEGEMSINHTTTNSKGSEVAWSLLDNNSWDVIKVRPYMDNLFKTVCFIVDSANSYTSFPHEANTQPAITWQTSTVPATSGFVGQATVVTITVKNTSPARSTQAGLPTALSFGVSAINFPGTFTVTPENVEISIGQSQTFTCTFTGASAGALQQQLRVTCYHPFNNGLAMSGSITFPLTLTDANEGLIVCNPQDTVAIARGSTISHVFNVKMVNVGLQAETVTFGADSASTGTTVSFGSLTGPVPSGDSIPLAITVTGSDTGQNYFTAYYWAEANGDTLTRSRHTLVIKMVNAAGIAHRAPKIIRELAMMPVGNGRIELDVPAGEQPTFKMFSANGRMVLSRNIVPGSSFLDVRALHLSTGVYILRLQGKKVVQQKMLVAGRR